MYYLCIVQMKLNQSHSNKMATTITNKEELAYIMKFYGIEYVPIINVEGKRLGRITNEMVYDTSNSLYHYIKEYEHLAFRDAINVINNDMPKLEMWREKAKQIFTTKLVYKGNTETTIKKSYLWNSDIEKTHLKVEKNEDGELVFSGNINDLKNFKSYANDHLRYCNGCRYTFENEEVNELIDLFNKYGLAPKGDSYEWWHVGIVD